MTGTIRSHRVRYSSQRLIFSLDRNRTTLILKLGYGTVLSQGTISNLYAGKRGGCNALG